VPSCQVPECHKAAVRGEDWTSSGLAPLVAFRNGIELDLTVRDLAVSLTLCEAHANDLTDAAWVGVVGLLDIWEWKPLGGTPQ
jgi:hypothetical protein